MDTNKLSPNAFRSPGNNPFDDLWKKTMDAISMSEQVNRRSSIQLFTNFPNMCRQSLSFHDSNASDFGRESLGILPPDFGRESLGFMNIGNLETDRESLGIIQINALRESLSSRRESLGILNLQDLGRESLDCGRESLGIFHVKSPDFKFGYEEKVPNILITTIDENSEQSYNVLDTAFLQPYSRRSSFLSSSSSVNPSFNSVSLEGISRISSVSSMKNFKDVVNLTYSTNSVLSSIHSPLNKGKIFSPSELNIRSRVQSVPVTSQFSPLNDKSKFGDISEKKFWSADRTTVLKMLERRSFREILNFEVADISNEFHDSVFIEGHILAEKIADGSILNESSVDEVGILDSTPQPDWPDISYNENKHDQKCDTEAVFKTVDKMLPPPSKDILNAKLKTSKTDSNSFDENVEKMNTSDENRRKFSYTSEQNISKLLHNISDIQHEPKKVSSSRKDPKEILENLSELLNCTNPSEKQKSEGKNLLNSLADILCESRSSAKNNRDDSGHSSINEPSDSSNKENHEFFEVLDLRAKTTDQIPYKENFCANTGVLDLSLKSKPIENVAGKRLSQSLRSSRPNVQSKSRTEKKSASASSLDMSKNKTSNSSVTSNNSKNNSNLAQLQISGKLRQKHTTSNMRKGPMKAIIPIGDMKKINTSGTPKKNEHMVSTMQSKRTSTPINEPKLKPMAASTPTICSTKDTPCSKNPKNIVDSPSAGPIKSGSSSAFTRCRAYSATSLPIPTVTNMPYKLRRNSVSDVKKPNEPLVRRRNSVERESGVISSVVRARQNLPYNQTRKQNPTVENKLLLENKGKEHRHMPVTKAGNLDSKCNVNKKVTVNKHKRTTSVTESSLKTVPSVQSKNGKTSTPTAHQAKTRMGNCEKRNSASPHLRSNEGKVKVTKRNSVGNVSGVMSSLAKIRQNILESPYFHLTKDDALNKNYIVLSENKELGRTSIPQFPHLKKTGKENTEK